MYIAECESGHVPATFAQTQSAGDFEAIFRSGIQLFIDFGGVAVFLTADRADFDFEHGVRLLRLVEQFLGDVQIFLERHGGAIPHMRLECRLLASCHLIGLMREQRTRPLIQILLGAVSVCRAMVMFGYFAATSCAKAASASEPVTRSLTPMPET